MNIIHTYSNKYKNTSDISKNNRKYSLYHFYNYKYYFIKKKCMLKYNCHQIKNK